MAGDPAEIMGGGSPSDLRELRQIEFVPIRPVSMELTRSLVARVSGLVRIPCRLRESPLELSLKRIKGRDQVDANALLERIEDDGDDPGTFKVGIVDRDLAIPIFTFVFGLARREGHAAVVSWTRLHPDFYGLPADPTLTVRRAVTEVLHELGHVAGLDHCEDFACLMHFAPNVETIDLRGERFCADCAAAAPEGLVTRRAGP